MDIKELKELMALLEESSLGEIEIEEEGRRIRLSKPAHPAPPAQYAPAPAPADPSPAPARKPAPQTMADDTEAEHAHTIDSPMVGTFYSSPAPGEPPFILPGDRVEAGQNVCIIEAMKIMNEVAAKEAAVIEHVLVENGEPVEFGQPLFAVRPL